MVQQDAETCPVAIEIVCEREAISGSLHKKLICSERLRCSKRTRLECIHGDRGNELIPLGLSKAARELATRESILSAIDLRGPEPLGNTRLANPRRGVDLCTAIKAPNNEVEELQVREKGSNTGLQEEAPQRWNDFSHRLKVGWLQRLGRPASDGGTGALKCIEYAGPLL